jgi:BirA family biotin operon repressor/biotin-[acetyl-CoA-carboxylase] ligase
MKQAFIPTILRFDSLPSTNTEAARQAASGAAEGLCVVAREQTAGRGRQQRAWASPLDAGLYFSVVLRPRLAPQSWPLLTLAAAIAVADALKEVCAVSVDIKWPNDILATDGRKLCGILAETVETKAGRACVLGIGINLTKEAFAPEIAERATSVEALTGARVELEAVLRALVKALGERYLQLESADGVEEIRDEWTARSSYAEGKRVQIALGAEIIVGTTRGLEPDGALRVETVEGEIKIVRAGDVSALRETRG